MHSQNFLIYNLFFNFFIMKNFIMVELYRINIDQISFYETFVNSDGVEQVRISLVNGDVLDVGKDEASFLDSVLVK